MNGLWDIWKRIDRQTDRRTRVITMDPSDKPGVQQIFNWWAEDPNKLQEIQKNSNIVLLWSELHLNF